MLRSQILKRMTRAYGFGAHRPQNAWQKYREQQMVAGMPPQQLARPATPIPMGIWLVISIVGGTAVPFTFFMSKRQV